MAIEPKQVRSDGLPIDARPVDTRIARDWKCVECGHEWAAPKASWCPRCCGVALVAASGPRKIDYRRV